MSLRPDFLKQRRQAGAGRVLGSLEASVLTGHSYADLEIREGGQASLEFLRVYYRDVADDERRKVREPLERYCGQDTEGMIWIGDALRKHAGGSAPKPCAITSVSSTSRRPGSRTRRAV